MADQNIELTQEEEKELRQGQALYEMDQTSEGWQIVKQWLTDMGYHAWVDPRGTTKEEWEWQEINAFHAANNAKEIFENIARMVSQSEYLSKIKAGEVPRQRMKI